MEQENIITEETEQELTPPVKNAEHYTPRPAWQVWAARFGLVLMLISVALYYWHIASGGMR